MADTTLTRADGSVCATIERDAEGVATLFTDRILIVDLELAQNRRDPGRNPLSRLFWWSGSLLKDRRQLRTHEIALLERVAASLAPRTDWGLRVYRMFGAIRLLATHAGFDPAGEPAQDFMRELGVDPAYAEWCRSNGRFRARVSPRPISSTKPYSEFEKTAATCHMLKRMGEASVDPEAALILQWHDRLSRAGSELPLA